MGIDEIEKLLEETNIKIHELKFILEFIQKQKLSPQLVMRQIKTYGSVEKDVKNYKQKQKKISFLEEEIKAKNTRLSESEKKLKELTEEGGGSIGSSEILGGEVEELQTQLNLLQKYHLENTQNEDLDALNFKKRVLSVVEDTKILLTGHEKVESLVFGILDEIIRAVEKNEQFNFDKAKIIKLIAKQRKNDQNIQPEQLGQSSKMGLKGKKITIKGKESKSISPTPNQPFYQQEVASPISVEKAVIKQRKIISKQEVQSKSSEEMLQDKQEVQSKSSEEMLQDKQEDGIFDSEYIPPSQRIKEREKAIEQQKTRSYQRSFTRAEEEETTESTNETATDEVKSSIQEEGSSTNSKILTPTQLAKKRRESTKKKQERISSSDYSSKPSGDEFLRKEEPKISQRPSSSKKRVSKKPKPKEKPQHSKKEITVLETFLDFIKEADGDQNLDERIKLVCDAEEAYTTLGSIALSKLYSYVTKPSKSKKEVVKLFQSWIKMGIPR